MSIHVIEAREVPLGGPRAMTVHRTLPSRERTTIGAWCFIDHYGPADVSETGGMHVPPHPHTGLQTVSWLFDGEIEHRDSVGSHAFVHPGTLNLMTAGHGISHSEVSTAATRILHGVQLWVALPDAARDTAPHFESHDAARTTVDDATAAVFVGSFAGAEVAAGAYSPLVAAELALPAGGVADLPLNPDFEYGVLVDTGRVLLDGDPVARTELAYLDTGRASVRVTAGVEPVRLVLIGGTPFGEKLLMWWNFAGRDHDEIVAFREEWRKESGAEPGLADAREGEPASPRFGATDHHYTGRPLPAPELPGVRLQPRSR
ncbi:pirin family protein [Herbiconiux moechotypicola]|uniref:Pirin family protein n=1 Tax=Herbiconiux moechotypicola TaxID=637393 RepID=A0ABP5R2V1_9MICO|nr:pirin family protein [Herbiconiux moechotypicola]MCS5731603.1 pirin family protein [Herbiconiux moechotypicola]